MEYFNAAKVYAADGQFSRAVSELESLKMKARAERSPNFAPLVDEASVVQANYYAKWAERLLDGGRQDEARRCLDKAEAAFSKYLYQRTPNYNLGVLYFRLKDSGKAKLYLGRFLNLEPKGPRADQVKSLLSKLDASG